MGSDELMFYILIVLSSFFQGNFLALWLFYLFPPFFPLCASLWVCTCIAPSGSLSSPQTPADPCLYSSGESMENTLRACCKGIKRNSYPLWWRQWKTEIDAALNNEYRVVPGMGEFGDRYFGTDDDWPDVLYDTPLQVSRSGNRSSRI